MVEHQSWGRFPRVKQNVSQYLWRHEPLPLPGDSSTVLPRGLGRSYGDSCLNDGNVLLSTCALDRFIAFDRTRGILTCEAGVAFEQVLRLTVPHGWFPPVTPGTKWITIGGAIANDVHGKNHHVAGSFGHHVIRFELLRSDGSRRVCSREQNPDWFHATIGGLGLTGLITWAEFRLRPIASPWIAQERIRFGGLDDFFRLSEESTEQYEFTVAWIDSFASGRALGRGLFIRGNHAPGRDRPPGRAVASRRRQLRVVFDAPTWVMNPWTLRVFNSAYYWRQFRRRQSSTVHYDPFFYPLDAIRDWNRLYGGRGFVQYQCVGPHNDGGAMIRELLARIAHARTGSFLAVLKVFGVMPSLGLLSFPRPGVTLALDFPMTGKATEDLLKSLDEVLLTAARGPDRAPGSAVPAVYPAKDARMSSEAFSVFFPRVEEFRRYLDPRFSSTFWRRVGG